MLFKVSRFILFFLFPVSIPLQGMMYRYHFPVTNNSLSFSKKCWLNVIQTKRIGTVQDKDKSLQAIKARLNAHYFLHKKNVSNKAQDLNNDIEYDLKQLKNARRNAVVSALGVISDVGFIIHFLYHEDHIGAAIGAMLLPSMQVPFTQFRFFRIDYARILDQLFIDIKMFMHDAIPIVFINAISHYSLHSESLSTIKSFLCAQTDIQWAETYYRLSDIENNLKIIQKKIEHAFEVCRLCLLSEKRNECTIKLEHIKSYLVKVQFIKEFCAEQCLETMACID